ncbi:MAG: hypothetical protein R6U69_03635, partial [Marinobacter sp.]|uniref:hypothetical protein n=1 Tax=Marinobacter sp. TaxID=50741 RepID=UPI003974D226
SSEPQHLADPKTHTRQYVVNSLLFIFTFWAVNQVAFLFTVTEGVSLFYPPSAYAMYLVFLLGGNIYLSIFWRSTWVACLIGISSVTTWRCSFRI